MEAGTVLLLVGAILAGSLVVALGAARVGVPSLIAFLVLGMVLGSDGIGGIHFDDAELARTVGAAGLAAILYEGGLSTSWRRLRGVAVPAVLLATVGVVVTALLAGAAAYWLLDLSWLEAVLLGAAGFFSLGAYGGINVVLAAFYAEPLRATGIGWAKSVGRLGTVIAPIVIGFALSAGLSSTVVMSLFAIPAVLAILALVTISRTRTWRAA